MRGGRESSFNRLDVFGLGSKGLYCGPIGLDLGEARGPFNEIQVDLGRVSRPNDLNGFKSEEFLNSFIDYIRYTPYTYIYTND